MEIKEIIKVFNQILVVKIVKNHLKLQINKVLLKKIVLWMKILHLVKETLNSS